MKTQIPVTFKTEAPVCPFCGKAASVVLVTEPGPFRAEIGCVPCKALKDKPREGISGDSWTLYVG